MARLIANVALFQAGWWACVLLARFDHRQIALPIVLALLAIHLLLIIPAGQRRREAALIASVGLAGGAIDTALHALGLLRINDTAAFQPAQFVPWILAFWLNFAATLSVSLRWFIGRPVLTAGLAALAAPGTYELGARLGALELHPDRWKSLGALALIWAGFLPVALLATARIRPGDGGDA